MELSGIKNAGIVVTGAAEGSARKSPGTSGRGGARLALIDRQAEAVSAIAGELGVTGLTADLTDEASIDSAIAMRKKLSAVSRGW